MNKRIVQLMIAGLVILLAALIVNAAEIDDSVLDAAKQLQNTSKFRYAVAQTGDVDGEGMSTTVKVTIFGGGGVILLIVAVIFMRRGARKKAAGAIKKIVSVGSNLIKHIRNKEELLKEMLKDQGDGIVHGVITSGGSPLAGAKVKWSSLEATTGLDGRYLLIVNSGHFGTNELKVEHAGHLTSLGDVRVDATHKDNKQDHNF